MIWVAQLRAWLARLLMPSNPPPMLLAPGRDEPQSVQQVARDLVERSRQGDQNADALLREVADQYKRNPNNQRLRESREAILKYIQANPVVSDIQRQIESGKLDKFALKMQHAWFNGDVDSIKTHLPVLASKSIPKAVVAVANGPNLKREYLDVIVGTMSEGEAKAFNIGIKHGLNEMQHIPEEFKAAFVLGHIIGTARKIQLCRRPGVPSSVLSPQLGIEFGECS